MIGLKRPKKEFTHNETVALMHEDSAVCLNKIADYAEKWEMGVKELIEYMREVADEKDAQAIVCRLRDEL